MFLLTGCDCGGAGILKIIKFVWQLLDIVFFLVPIGLIVMVSIDFGKNVIAGKEDEMKKNVNIAIKRIIYAVALFLLPTIVQFVINVLGDLGVAYADCINIARTEDLAAYESCTLINVQDESGNDFGTISKIDYYFSTSDTNCSPYQPRYKNNIKLEKTGKKVSDGTNEWQTKHGITSKGSQNVWTTGDGEYYVWIGNGQCGGSYKNVTEGYN